MKIRQAKPEVELLPRHFRFMHEWVNSWVFSSWVEAVGAFKMAASPSGKIKDYTAIQMTDQSTKGSNNQGSEQKESKRDALERPFDEDFWNKVKLLNTKWAHCTRWNGWNTPNVFQRSARRRLFYVFRYRNSSFISFVPFQYYLTRQFLVSKGKLSVFERAMTRKAI